MRKKQTGFSRIGLLIVVAIILILATIAIPNLLLNSGISFANSFQGAPTQSKRAFLGATWLKSTKLLLSITPIKLPQERVLASGWQSPQRGWLYVMDYDSGHPGSEGQVLLIEPNTGRTAGKLIVGSAPEMALSQDGKRLYVASGLNTGDALSVVDTTNGAVLRSVPIRYRWQYTAMPQAPTMAVSPDGLWVYLLKARTITRDHDEFTVASFDVTHGAFSLAEAAVPGCGFGLIFPSPDNQRVHVLCQQSDDIHVLVQGENGLQALPPPFPLRSVSQAKVIRSTGALSPEGNLLAIGSHVGGILETLEIDLRTGPVGRVLAQDKLADRWVPARSIAKSPDGEKLYVAVGQLATRSTGKADGILVLDARTGKTLKMWTTNHSFWGLAVSPDGKLLYLLDNASRTIFELDTTTYQDVQSIKGIGMVPSRIIVAP